MTGTSRVYARVDLDAILENMDAMHRNLKPGVEMAAVIKTDGYGHGAVPIAEKLEKLPYLWGFCTATFEEAEELRENGVEKPILILGYCFPETFEKMAELHIRPAVFREDQLEELSEAAARTGEDIHIHIAVDTGMSRIGVRPDESGLDFVQKALAYPGIVTEGIFTHFAKADETDPAATARQLDAFRSFTEKIEEKLHYRIPIRHCANSAGLIRFKETDMDMVRAGITLYGLWPSEEVPKDIVRLRPALSLHSRIIYIKTVPAGTAVSYGGTYKTKAEEKLATIPVGYGDGYPRSLSNKGYVLIHGRRAPIRGRVCMDQMMVDVSDIPQAREGDPVTLVGTDGGETITCEEIGDLSGRFNYEFVCDLGKRVPRIYTD